MEYMEGYIRVHHGKTKGFARMRQWLLGLLTPAFAVCLAVGVFVLGPTTTVFTPYAATFNNIVNTNIGLHPKWEMSKPETYTRGGVGDNYTGQHNVWHVKVKDAAHGDNDPILEQSPSYVFQGTEKNASELIERYSLKKGNEVVFNVTEGMSPAKVWADAVAFAQSLGTPTDLADPSILNCTSSGGWGADEYHFGFRVGTNTNERNKYQGNFFIENEDGALGQYITVRLHTDWVAKNITASAPTSATTTALNPAALTSNYITVSGSTAGAIHSTSFNYISNAENNSVHYLPTSDSSNGFTRIDTNDNDNVIAYDLSSNSADYDDGRHGIFNENCAFSFGRINVPTGVYIVLDLNGHTIDRNLTNGSDRYGQVFHISSKSRLEICDTSAYENASSLRIEGNSGNYTTNHKGTIKGGNAGGSSFGLPAGLLIDLQQNGGGFNLSMWADLVIHSGTIENNKSASTGGAFYERSKSSVTIYDGYILENTAGTAGGVTSLGSGSGCSFCMYGGVLAYNKAGSNGGAVYLGPSSFGNFHGGEIVNNTATEDAGALYVNGNTLGILDSVTIKDNHAGTHGGAVFVNHTVAAVDQYLRTDAMGTAFKFRGSLQIYNNTAGSGSTAENVYLEYDTTAATWDVSGTGQNGKKLNQLVPSARATSAFPKIGIGGSMFVNGIVARVGVTLSSAVPASASTVFTSGYAKAHGDAGSNNGVNTYVYFFSDATGKSVINNGSGTAMEAQLGGTVPSNGNLTWVVKGTGIYNGREESITIKAEKAESKLYQDRQGGISYTYEGLTCEFRMLRVTSVAAYTKYDEGNSESNRVAYWEVQAPVGTGPYEIYNSFTRAQFRFKLGEKDIEDQTSEGHKLEFNSDMYKVINATDHCISYAGEYSFLVASDNTRYTNPNFKIRINQVGVEVDRQLYYNGTDVTTLGWHKDINWNNDKNSLGEDIIDEKTEKDQPYFIYTGGYYYPILSADYKNEAVQMLSLYNPFDKSTHMVAKKDFTGYVLDFSYANGAYFGYASGSSGKGVPVDFGDHSGGGIEYRTMHRQPGQVEGVGTYVPGVMHAGTYSVSFVSSRTAASADAVSGDAEITGVYFAANNFAFSSAVNIYVAPAGAEVQLTEKARNNFTYDGTTFDDREIVEFDNTSDTSVNPHTDAAARMVYYLFDKLSYKAGIYDIRTGLYYTLDQIKNWEANRPWGSDESPEKEQITEKRPKLTDLKKSQIEAKPVVTYDSSDGGGTFDPTDTRFSGVLAGANLTAFQAEYAKTRAMGSTGRLCYIIDAESFSEETYEQPLDARRYIVLVTLDLDVGYDDYDYEFDQDAEHLVGIDGKSDYFWAFEFTIDPAEVDPYELLAGAVAGSANTSVSITKDHIYNNKAMAPTDERLSLSISFGTTLLEQGKDFTVSFPTHKTDGTTPVDYTNASVTANPGDVYNLPLIIKFDGTNKNYVNKTHTASGDVVTSETGLKGSAAHEYGTEGDYAFVVYFRIKPVEVTVSGSLTYTYDGSSFERARYLPARDGYGEDDAWFESIFFLVQDNETTSSDLIDKQHGAINDTEDNDLDNLWGGTKGDMHRYQSRFTLTTPTVSFTDSGFMGNGLHLGIGLYAFNTGDSNAKSSAYHLTTVSYDNKGNTAGSEGATLIKPEETGVTWLISYKQADGKQVQEFNTSQNFVINQTASFLDVTINPKNLNELAGDITNVGIDSFKHWSPTIKGGTTTLSLGEGGNVATGISYPFAGNNWKYEPGVTIQYQPFYYAASVASATGKTAYGNALTLGDKTDFTISYMNNSSASTDSNSARIMLNGQGNYTGTLTLEFNITPAQIAVTYAGVGAVPQYDKTAHGVNVTYANVEGETAYQKPAEGGILVSTSGSGTFNPKTDKPQPDPSVYSITYLARTRTAEGFGGAASSEDITGTDVPIDAGVYDVKIYLGSNDYQFVSGTGGGSYFTPVEGETYKTYKKTATGTHTILPAVVSYAYANSGETYNTEEHTPQVTFTNITYQKYNDLRSLQNVIPLDESEYKVTLAPKGTSNYKPTAVDAGYYTVKVELLSHNYCFSLTLDTADGFIKGYKDGSTGESNYPSSTNGSNFSYGYTVRDNAGKQYNVEGNWAAPGVVGSSTDPGDFIIKKAQITIQDLASKSYNRNVQTADWSFYNGVNTAVVPEMGAYDKSGTNVKYAIKTTDGEEPAGNKSNYSDPNSRLGTKDGVKLPYYKGTYTLTVTLTENDAKNFEFIIPEGVGGTVQKSGGGVDNDTIVKDFQITSLGIFAALDPSSVEYNAQMHFISKEGEDLKPAKGGVLDFIFTSPNETSVEGISYNVLFTEFKSFDPSAEALHLKQGDTEYDLLVKIGGYTAAGDVKTYAATTFFLVSRDESKTETEIEWETLKALLQAQKLFIDAGTYTVNLSFEYGNFVLRESLTQYTYTITQVALSASLASSGKIYDRAPAQFIKESDGILQFDTSAITLTGLIEGDESVIRGIFGYDGWAATDGPIPDVAAYKQAHRADPNPDPTNGYRNAGSYTVTIEVPEYGNYRFGNLYSYSMTYVIEKRGITGFTPTYQDDETLKDHAGSAAVGYHYTGSAITPTVTLTNKDFGGGISLKSEAWSGDGVNYASAFEIAYKDNVNAGEATVTMTGINNFTGTRESHFYVLPAIVSVTAKDNSGHSETFNPNDDPQSGDMGSLTFSYNKTLQTVSFEFENICGTGAMPNSGDYIITYYAAADWDEKNNKPNEKAEALSGVTDQGKYFVWIQFTKGTSKKFSNFVFYKEDNTADDIDHMFPDEPFLFAYKFKINVTPAQIQIHLAEQFKSGSEFVNTFGYNKQNWATTLNSAELTGTKGVVPTSSDYELFFSTDGTEETKIPDASNAGSYYLVFKLIDEKGNYTVNGVYAGTGDGAVALDSVEKDGKGYHAEDEESKHITVFFTVTPADIAIHLSDTFASEAAFTNSFVYTRTNRYTALSVISITNANFIIPLPSDYTLSFKTDLAGEDTTAVTDVGKYYLVFKLKKEIAGNYNVTGIYAGGGTDVSLDHVENADGDGYYGDMKDFSVKFDITPAQIEVYLSEDFRNGKAFVNEFGYNKGDWATALNTVQFRNVLRNGVYPQSGEFTVDLKTVTETSEEKTAAVKNAGSYKLILRIAETVKKNYVITAVYAGTPTATDWGSSVKLTEGTNYVKLGDNDGLRSFSVAFKITPAKIQVHVSEQFKTTSESVTTFVNKFTYNKSSRKNELGAVTLSGVGENGVVPANGEYTAVIEVSSGGDATITNVGTYRLVFTLLDDVAGNYVITAIYVGDGSDFSLLGHAGGAYTALDGKIDTGDLKKFGLSFEITPAKVDLYLNGFISGGKFTNQFVYDGTDQSLKLGSVGFTNDNNIIPATQGYSVNFFYVDVTDPEDKDANNDVFDAGKYFLHFALTDGAGGNYVLRDVYAGPTGGGVLLTTDQYRGKTTSEVYIDFELTPSEINVFFSSSDLVKEGAYVSSFHYDRTDWTNRFGMVVFDTVVDGVGTTPTNSQYDIEFYGGTFDGKDERWDRETTLGSITDVGRYSVTFRLRNTETGHYPGKLYYNNYVIVGVYAGGTKIGVEGVGGDCVQLDKIDLETNPTGTNGYRRSQNEKDDVYVTLVFDINPAPIEIHLADGFKNEAESKLSNSFVYNKSNRALTLNSSSITGTTTPNPEEYYFIFANEATAEKEGGLTTVIDVGKYYLVFKLTDPKGNYEVKGIYAGGGTGVSLSSVGLDGDGYYGELKAFSVKFEITPAPITVHIAGDFDGGDKLKSNFPYNKSDYATALRSISFAGDYTTPDSSEYKVLLNKTGDADTDLAKVIDAGGYYLVFTLIGGGAKNYVIKAIDTGAAEGAYTLKKDDYTQTSGDSLTAFKVGFTIDTANIEVYLSSEFVKSGAFNSTFDYDRSNWVNKLNSVMFKNIGTEDDTVPTVGTGLGADCNVSFGNPTAVTSVTDAGSYSLIFTLNNKNFVINAVYAGTEPDHVAAEKTDTESGFTVSFTIKKAEIEVYLPDSFRDGSNFLNEFGFNKTDWITTLGAIQFKNVQRNSVVPLVSDYKLTFRSVQETGNGEAKTVTNVGAYKLALQLIGADKDNFVITKVFAGAPDVEPDPAEVTKVETDNGKGYYTKDTSEVRSFTVYFTIAPAVLDLYLNAFRAKDAFAHSFVFDGTDQSVKLGSVDFKNEGNIVPATEGYTVSFFYDEAPVKGSPAAQVIDAGGYYLVFTLTSPNYTLRNVYAGTIAQNTEGEPSKPVLLEEGNYTDKDDTSVNLGFTLTPANINVYFTATELKSELGSGEKEFVNNFYYDRNNWASRLGVVSLENTMEGNSAVPQGTQYFIEFYECESYVEGESESWDSTSLPIDGSITDVGRYSVTFRLSKAETGNYKGKKHYNNYTVNKVFVGGTREADSLEISAVDRDKDPTAKNGYRTSKDPTKDVYVTIVFDIDPAVVKLEAIGDKVYNGNPQDAGFTFGTVGKGSVLPQAGDYTAAYAADKRDGKATGNEKVENGKPLNAGAYTVTVELSDNFVFDKAASSAGDADEHAAKGYFSITPAVLSAYLGYLDGEGAPVHGALSMDYDGVAHEYSVFTEMNSAETVERVPEGEGQNCAQKIAVQYNGWAGNVEGDEVSATSDGYKNAGTYTLTLSYYIIGTDTPGGNFCFGSGNYSITLSYTILARTIKDSDVHGIENGETKIYNGKPQTNGIEVRMTLVEGEGEKTLTLYNADNGEGDYSISNTSDVNVGYVTNFVTGMHNFQGVVNLSYHIDPATVTAAIDKTEAFYDRSEQVRSFTFVNQDGNETVLPAYNATNTDNSDYIITYAYDGKAVSAPCNAGVYTVTVTLQNSTGLEGNRPNFKFADEIEGATKVEEYVATFTFTVTKAEIYLDVIPGASYTGEARDAILSFVNAANPAVVPQDYDVTYDGSATVPTHVKTNGENRTPVAYDVKVTLKDVDNDAMATRRDLSNFKFVTHSSKTYAFDDPAGTWGQEAYKITPAVITGSLSVTIDGEPADSTTKNGYDTKKHILDVVFRNINAGFEDVIPNGTKGEPSIADLAAAYNFTEGEKVLYTLKITFSPYYSGFTSFDGIPENAGSYLVAVQLVSADFSFANDRDSSDWTYVIANAKIESDASLGTPENSTTFVRSLVFAPDNPQEITLTKDNFKFIDKADGFNAANAMFTFTSCTGAAYATVANEEGLTIGYRLQGAGLYTIAVTVSAPNHDQWAIILKVTVTATAIELTVLPEAQFTAVYGDENAYSPEAVLEQVLQFIRDGKITVEGISGTPDEQADTLIKYGFGIGILALDGDYSGAKRLQVGGYGLKIDKLEVSGFDRESFVVFKANGTTEYTDTVFTVTPLAIEISTKDAINDLRYNGNSLVNDAADNVVIANRLEGDVVDFESVYYNLSEGGNFNNGSVFDMTDAVHVGNYWVHVFSTSGDNGLHGADARNYCIEEKDQTSDSIRYYGTNGVYVAFEIKRREVDLAIADSTSVYGDDIAVYGTDGTKSFNFSYVDNVLTKDFGSGDKAEQLKAFVLDLLALFNSDETKLEQGETPYPGAGNYTVKLDPEAGKGEDWVLGGGKFNFDGDFILHIDGAQSGKHTIAKRTMRVNVHDYSSYYGEALKESGFEKIGDAWGFTPLDEFVAGDSEEDLAITITVNESAFAAQGTRYGLWWGAMTYQGGLTPVSLSANYSVTFTEGTGNYTVMRRPIIVLIGSQTTVYGEPILKDLSGLDGNWTVYGTVSDENMGYATGDTRSELKITLTLDGVVNETASAGVYTDVIKGSCGNPNYQATFRNWVTEGGNEPGEREGGDYEITRRNVAIRIGTAEAVYGTEGLHVGAQISLIAPAYPEGSRKPTNAAQWTYDFDKADYTILPEHLGYLTFYLGKADPANAEKTFAKEGTHAIVGVWGYNYDEEMIFMKSYDVQFYGAWEGIGKADPYYQAAGVYTVTPAEITQRPESEWTKSYSFRMWQEGGEYTSENGWYAMSIPADYLVYAGDYTVASNGKLTFSEELSDDAKLVYLIEAEGGIRVTVTYRKPTNADGRTEVESVNDLWTVHSVGEWRMEITVEAENHKTATFRLIYTINSVTARVSLNSAIGPHTFVYGEQYNYPELAEGNADYNYTLGAENDITEYQVTKELNEYLLNSLMILTVDGLSEAYPDLTSSERKQLIIDHCHVEVIGAELSSAKLLRAGTYSLRIVAEPGCGFTVSFMDSDNYNTELSVDNTGDNRLVVQQKEVGIDWATSERELHLNETKPTVTADAITYTYNSFAYDYKPLFTGVVEGDLVEKPDSHYYDHGVETTAPDGPKNVGEYSVVITDLLKGKDEANYKLPETLTKPLIIEKMKVTVTVYDREITYGEDHPAKTGPIFDHGKKTSDGEGWTCDRLGANDYVSDLGVTLGYIDENGAPIGDHAGAGVYGIKGTATGSNYDVEFRNAAGDEADAVFTIWRSNITIHIMSYGEDGSIHYGDTPYTPNFVVDEKTPIARWDDNADLGVELTVGNGREKDAKSYYILGAWTNKDYNITFTGDWTGELPADYLCEDEDGAPTDKPQGAGTYVISPLLIKLTLQPTKESLYGEYSFDGAMETPTFYEFALSTVRPLTGYDYATFDGVKETAADLKLTWTLPEVNDAGVYTIKAVDNDNNYIIDFDDSVLVWTVMPRPITVTIHTQHSTYGDAYVTPGNTAVFWKAEDALAPWHDENPYAALALRLWIDEDILKAQANAGEYRNAIKAEPTENEKNYAITYHNDEGQPAPGGTYVIDRSTVIVKLLTQHTTYGDGYVTLDNTSAFWKAEEGLAPWHTADPYTALGMKLSFDDTILGAQAKAGTYKNAIKAEPQSNTGNYTFVYHNEEGEPALGTYVVDQREIHLTMQAENTSVYGEVSVDGAMDTKKFEDELRKTFARAAGYTLASWDTIEDLKIIFKNLPTLNDAGKYEGIRALESEVPGEADPNYIIVFDNEAVWNVTPRPIAVTIHTQHSTYGDGYAPLDNTATFWKAEDALAPWHNENPYTALALRLWIDEEILGDQANAGTYKNAIKAEPTENETNYEITYRNDEGESAPGGTYVVDRRKITLQISKDLKSTYGDFYEADAFNAYIARQEDKYTLVEGSLASWDEANADFALDVVLEKQGGYHVGVYPVKGEGKDKNYDITLLDGSFEIEKATNDWRKHFSLESMNEGEMPDEELLTATAYFGEASVKYYYDELCEREVTEDGLDALPAGTYYAKITVDGTLDYTNLSEIKAFVVNESFLVVNGVLDVTLYVCIYASQFIILTSAAIFIRRKKTDEDETEEMK